MPLSSWFLRYRRRCARRGRVTPKRRTGAASSEVRHGRVSAKRRVGPYQFAVVPSDHASWLLIKSCRVCCCSELAGNTFRQLREHAP